jgi:FAD/FMN-containing dehydrogenase
MATVVGRGLDAARVRELEAGLRGSLLRPDDDRYEQARHVWNARIDRRPRLIVCCAGVSDVISAVRFVRSQNALVSVRGGAHNVAGSAVCDDGVMIDLSGMRALHVDPARRVARAEPGLTWADFDHDTQAFGLATTGAHVSSTGIAGSTLGGGMGWLMRQHGLTIDNLLSADIVTADGQLVTASPDESPDLFWAIRGGGGNFGIATSLEYRLHPVGPLVAGGVVMYPASQAHDVLRGYREVMTNAPEELSALAAFRSAPPAPFVPEDVRGRPIVAIVACATLPTAEALRRLEPLRQLGAPVAERMGPMPYAAIQRMLDGAGAFGYRVYVRSDHLGSLDDVAIDTLIEHAARRTSPHSVVLLFSLGGAVSRVNEHATAFSHRHAAFDYAVYSLWKDASDDERHIHWTDRLWSAMRPFAVGAYVNELGDEGDARVREAYSASTYDRLVSVKNRYDPTNVFRLNQNIHPTV